MLTIRFNRVGRHNRVYYRIVVQEHSAAPGGRHIAVVGSYDPYQKKAALKEEAIKHWLSVGAKPSDTVHNLLVKHQIIVGQKKRPKGKVIAPKEDVVPEGNDAATEAESGNADGEAVAEGSDVQEAEATKEKKEEVEEEEKKEA